MNFMTKLLSLLLIVILISSCTSPAKQLLKAYNNDPVVVAKFCRDKFPCSDGVLDTLVKTEYDFIELKCDNDTITQSDTLFIPVNKKPKSYTVTKTKFIASPVVTKTIIKLIRDSAEIKYLKETANIYKEKYYILRDKQDNKAEWIKWLLIILSASLLLNMLFISNKK